MSEAKTERATALFDKFMRQVNETCKEMKENFCNENEYIIKRLRDINNLKTLDQQQLNKVNQYKAIIGNAVKSFNPSEYLDKSAFANVLNQLTAFHKIQGEFNAKQTSLEFLNSFIKLYQLKYLSTVLEPYIQKQKCESKEDKYCETILQFAKDHIEDILSEGCLVGEEIICLQKISAVENEGKLNGNALLDSYATKTKMFPGIPTPLLCKFSVPELLEIDLDPKLLKDARDKPWKVETTTKKHCELPSALQQLHTDYFEKFRTKAHVKYPGSLLLYFERKDLELLDSASLFEQMANAGVLSNINAALKDATPIRKQEIHDNLKLYFTITKKFKADEYRHVDFSVLFGPKNTAYMPTERKSKGEVPTYIADYFRLSQWANQVGKLSLKDITEKDFLDMKITADQKAPVDVKKRTPKELLYLKLQLYSDKWKPQKSQ